RVPPADADVQVLGENLLGRVAVDEVRAGVVDVLEGVVDAHGYVLSLVGGLSRRADTTVAGRIYTRNRGDAGRGEGVRHVPAVLFFLFCRRAAPRRRCHAAAATPPPPRRCHAAATPPLPRRRHTAAATTPPRRRRHAAATPPPRRCAGMRKPRPPLSGAAGAGDEGSELVVEPGDDGTGHHLDVLGVPRRDLAVVGIVVGVAAVSQHRLVNHAAVGIIDRLGDRRGVGVGEGGGIDRQRVALRQVAGALHVGATGGVVHVL